MIFPLVLIGKFIAWTSRLFNFGSGGTWPGEIALRIYPDIFPYYTNKLNKGLILIAGTNGKTTTAKMISQILSVSNFEDGSDRIIHNDSGANLLNGLISTFIDQSSWFGKLDADYAIFEIDEATLPIVLSKLTSFQKKIVIVLLNLFRDQLDRYGEIDTIVSKWQKALTFLSKKTTLVLNADDPQIAYLGNNARCQVDYFGINKPDKFLANVEHATDSIYCRKCGNRLTFEGVYFSHLGIWHCDKCNYCRPKPKISQTYYPIPGLYNEYNALAAATAVLSLGISLKKTNQSLANFKPAFGRQEEFNITGRKIKLFLSKNPAGYNESLRTVLELNPKIILLVLNDRIPDGRDVSWIWDVDFEMIPPDVKVIVSGDRVYDMGLRIKYTSKIQNAKFKMQNYNLKLKIIESLRLAIDLGLKEINRSETLYILPTYSAMLEVRKILTGKKIL